MKCLEQGLFFPNLVTIKAKGGLLQPTLLFLHLPFFLGLGHLGAPLV